VKITDILFEQHDEEIHSWVALRTGVDIGKLTKDADELFKKRYTEPEESAKQLEEILTTIHDTFENDAYWNEAFKFGEIKAHQIADELSDLETKITSYLK
jgi:hypothetical protein